MSMLHCAFILFQRRTTGCRLPKTTNQDQLGWLQGVLLGILLCVTAPAHANDASAQLDANGIRLVQTYDIALDVEDLYISPEQVKIHYEFINKSEFDKNILVAFPVPEIDADTEANYNIDPKDPINFLDFSILVNGRKIEPQVEIKLTANGVDFTETLLAHGVPLNRFEDDYYDNMENMSQDNLRALAQEGLVDWTPGESYFTPKWKMKATFYWQQAFPAQSRTIIDHSYRPVAGVSIFSEEYGLNQSVERYCIEPSFRRAFQRKVAQSGHNEMLAHEVRYILQTANTWLGPIRDFRLVIDKLKPSNLVSLCINGISKIAPTQFEVRAQNYVPKHDLEILVVEQPAWD
ncbi:DUF4424 family protein [Cohaesibacter celericrescens]|uniref:DUF4424 family protein n=1 Tax=Cohaesibacter celericrescens TaxID=2067669 RepID=UPI0035615479